MSLPKVAATYWDYGSKKCVKIGKITKIIIRARITLSNNIYNIVCTQIKTAYKQRLLVLVVIFLICYFFVIFMMTKFLKIL